ncbi:MAG: redoxin domain-containing protein [Pseudobacter sp.]|uniref:redoxin domain-containing protein n=1 Tax=Pseudobacter sp. TaxID=2045420 RepID=UPI003F800E14
MKYKSLSWMLSLLLLASASTASAFQKKFELQGKAVGRNGQKVQLVIDYYGNSKVLGTDSIVNDRFSFISKVDEITPVSVVFYEGKSSAAYSVILEPAALQFVLFPNGRKQVTGGKYNKALFGFETDPAYIKADDEMRENSRNGIQNIKDPEVQYKAMQVFLRRNELRTNALEKVMNSSKDIRTQVMAAVLLELQPDSKKAMAIVDKAAAQLGEKSLVIQAARKLNKNQEMMINARKNQLVGKDYYDFSAVTLTGDSTRISQLMKENKYTLVQFWASWCVPCRKEIPLLKKMFAENQGKGFGIIAFSLDDNKIAWTKASEKENFSWPNISDLKAFSSVIVKEYKINGIPANVIIDQHGKIVANNLVGEDLENKVRELFK